MISIERDVKKSKWMAEHATSRVWFEIHSFYEYYSSVCYGYGTT